MHEHPASRLRVGARIGRRASEGDRARHRRRAPADAANLAERAAREQEVDRAFLDWLEARLGVGRDIRDEDVLDYLVALALYNRTWSH
jgi:hypothetical protein